MWQKTIKIHPHVFILEFGSFFTSLFFPHFGNAECRLVHTAWWAVLLLVVLLLLESAYFRYWCWCSVEVARIRLQFTLDIMPSVVDITVCVTKKAICEREKKNSLKTINGMMFCEGEQAIHWWLVLLLLFQPRICLLWVNGTLWAFHGFLLALNRLVYFTAINLLATETGNWYPNHNQNWWFSERLWKSNNWFIS